MNILLVDDDNDVRNALARSLKMRGEHVIDMPIPAEALEFLATADMAEDFDLVLTDYQMPRMNGLELARSVRRLYQLPVIIISGDVERFERDMTKEERAQIPLLKKPFAMKQLDELLKHFVLLAASKTKRPRRG